MYAITSLMVLGFIFITMGIVFLALGLKEDVPFLAAMLSLILITFGFSLWWLP